MKFLSSWGTTYERKVFVFYLSKVFTEVTKLLSFTSSETNIMKTLPLMFGSFSTHFQKGNWVIISLAKSISLDNDTIWSSCCLSVTQTLNLISTNSAGSSKTQISWKKRKIKRIVGIIFSFTTERFINGERLSEAVMSWTCSVELHIKRSKLLRA